MAPYRSPHEITDPVSNNAFSFRERQAFHTPVLHIPALQQGGTLQEGSHIAFEEVEEGRLISCTGLRHFLRYEHPETHAPITVMDNHNHALYFWLEAFQQKQIDKNSILVHVDQHKDMRDPGVDLPPQAFEDPEVAFRFTNEQVNVGNFIVPALRSGLVRDVLMMDSDVAFEQFSPPEGPYILDIDVDVFAPELDYMNRDRMRAVIRELFTQAACVTIATSPYFISFAEAKYWTETLLAEAGILR